MVERALTIFLNSQEIVTAMTIGDYPEYLALGYLLNQHMLLPNDTVTSVDYDEDLAVVVVRTRREAASAVVRWASQRGATAGSWLARMLARKPRMLVIVALANKTARIVWALLVKGGTYRAPAVAA